MRELKDNKKLRAWERGRERGREREGVQTNEGNKSMTSLKPVTWQPLLTSLPHLSSIWSQSHGRVSDNQVPSAFDLESLAELQLQAVILTWGRYHKITLFLQV